MLCIVRDVLFSVNKYTYLCSHLELSWMSASFECATSLQLKKVLRITIPTS